MLRINRGTFKFCIWNLKQSTQMAVDIGTVSVRPDLVTVWTCKWTFFYFILLSEFEVRYNWTGVLIEADIWLFQKGLTVNRKAFQVGLLIVFNYHNERTTRFKLLKNEKLLFFLKTSSMTINLGFFGKTSLWMLSKMFFFIERNNLKCFLI